MEAQAVLRPAGHRALVWRERPATAGAAVLVLHGGQENGLRGPGTPNLPGQRMRPFARAVERVTAGREVAVGVVRYRCRGWNGDRADAARAGAMVRPELVTGPRRGRPRRASPG